MKPLSLHLQEAIQESPMLQFGFSHRLFSLSQLSRFLQPLIEARAKKSVQVTALTMNLSRLQRNLTRVLPPFEKFKTESISIISDLCTMTFPKTLEAQKKVHKFSLHVQQEGSYINLTESSHEITLIFEKRFLSKAEKEIGEKPKYENYDLVAVGVRFSPEYSNIPGFIYTVLQRTTLQGINTVELSSTYTELILYIERKDANLAFDTILQSFSGN